MSSTEDMRLDEVLRVARHEAEHATLPVTRQYRSAGMPLREAGELKVARCVEDPAGHFRVYFPIAPDGRHYLMVSVRVSNGDPSLGFVSLEATVRVRLSIVSDTLHPDQITSRIGIEPTQRNVAGTPRPVGSGVFPAHWWMLEPDAGSPGSVEEKLDRLLERVAPVARSIRALAPECAVTVAVVYDGWRGNPQFGGWMLDPEHLTALTEMGASIGFDLYATGEGELGDGSRAPSS